jgi:hypothetical protein
MNALVQDIAVSVIALGAAGMIVRRAVAMFAGKPTSPGCASCPSRCASRPQPAGAATVEGRRIIRPLVVSGTPHEAPRT